MNLHPISTRVTKPDREKLLNQRAKVIWFTGLSGSGKSTLAVRLEAQLHERGFKTYLLDGDTIRSGLNNDLAFDEAGRRENIRRIGEVCKLFMDAGVIVLSAFISPFKSDREKVRKIVGNENYIEVFVDAPLEVCEQRDVKGLYRKARAGEIKEFTGIDSPYEIPDNPDIVLQTHKLTVTDSLQQLERVILPKIRQSSI
ncbi:MAG: adenylyl-sulfate kinase [Flammeovirgaceae bacterium]|nr:MAG: adenylyl-sulfate kinase [Flammeovirgaceae bacterium]